MCAFALLVIDVQNDFVAKGAPIECAGARKILKPLAQLANLARRNNVPVIFSREEHRSAKVDFGLELDYGEPLHCLEGSPGVAFHPELEPTPDDFIVVKRRYSAFFATDLEILLKGLGVDTLILTGVATDVCVRATAQDAHQLNYRVVVPKNCVAGTTQDRHRAALDNISYVFGKVCNFDDAKSLLQREIAFKTLSHEILTAVHEPA